MPKTYFLPEGLKKELRKIWGAPIFGKKKEVFKKFKILCQKKKFKKIITVGDYCSMNLPSNIRIFDGKIKRKKVKKLLPYFLICQNPAGTIQKEVWPIIKKAIKERKNIFVDGEEDLLVIPAVLLSGKNTAVIYGFPKKGVCLIEVNQKTKNQIKNLLKKFKSSSKYEQ